MEKKSPVFEETYRKYLDQISGINLESLKDKLGITIVNDNAVVPLFNRQYTVSSKGIACPDGKQPPLEINVVLCRYLLMCPDPEPSQNDWVSFKDFRDSGPLVTFYLNDVENPIAKHYSSKTGELKKACNIFNGTQPEIDLSCDLTMQIISLPKIPMLLIFNDADEEFPASCSVLFKKSADKYLDCESLAILGALFSNFLRIRNSNSIWF